MSPARTTLRLAQAVAVLMLSARSAATPSLAAESEPQRASPSSKADATPKALSLDAWRALNKEADALFDEPQGPERIARLETFLKAHPDYPDTYSILYTLVSDMVATADYDLGRLAGLLEKLAAEGDEAYPGQGLGVVEEFFLNYDLPLEGAERLVERARRGVERSRALAEKEPDSRARERWKPETTDFRILLDEGRILLARGDAAGALKSLREAEQKAVRTSLFVQSRDLRGKQTKIFDTDSPFLNWMNLSMAEALARLGDKGAARDRLSRVPDPDIFEKNMAARLQKLRGELGVTSPAVTEVRTDPAPAPDFTLEDLDGKKVTLSDYRGKVVLVMLWTTW